MHEEKLTYNVAVHHEDGSVWAEVLELPGCFATGEDMDDLWRNVAESISLYVSSERSQVSLQVEHVGEPHRVDEVETRELAVCG